MDLWRTQEEGGGGGGTIPRRLCYGNLWPGYALENATKGQAVTRLQAAILLQPCREAPAPLPSAVTILHIPALRDCAPVLNYHSGCRDAARTNVLQPKIMLVICDAPISLPAV